jgi:phosphoribosyl 1,2-cyclic phosphodiesterase
MVDLKLGDVYLDRDKQLVIVCMDYTTKNMYLVSFHTNTNEFLSFSSTLGNSRAIISHLAVKSKFIFNLAGPFKELLKQVTDNET